MKKLRIEKVTLNVGAGKNQDKLEKGIKLIKNLSGSSPVKTFTTKRIPAWGLRPGLPIGCKLTVRKKKAHELLARMLSAKDNMLKERQFDNEGNIAFGIHEYIDIPGADYDPDVGIMGLEVCVTLERPGFRIKRRSIRKKSVPKVHKISKQDSIEFMKNEFKITIGDNE